MQTLYSYSRTLAITVAIFLGLGAPASAALFAPPPLVLPAGGAGSAPDHNIANLSLDLALAVDASVVGQTSLTYSLTLNEDANAVWTVVDFAIIRAWSEGAASNLSNNLGWGGSATGHFMDWSGATAPALTEGNSASFGYTVDGGVPSGQLFVYYVTKDGGDAFPVLSNDAATLRSAQVVVPEPTALVLVGIAALGLWRRRVA